MARFCLADRRLCNVVPPRSLPTHVRRLCLDWVRPLPPERTLQWVCGGLQGERAHKDWLSPRVLRYVGSARLHRTRADGRVSGCGALVSPLIATQFSKQSHWSYHYLISGGLYAVNSVLLWYVFRGRRQEGATRPLFYPSVNAHNPLQRSRRKSTTSAQTKTRS